MAFTETLKRVAVGDPFPELRNEELRTKRLFAVGGIIGQRLVRPEARGQEAISRTVNEYVSAVLKVWVQESGHLAVGFAMVSEFAEAERKKRVDAFRTLRPAWASAINRAYTGYKDTSGEPIELTRARQVWEGYGAEAALIIGPAGTEGREITIGEAVDAQTDHDNTAALFTLTNTVERGLELEHTIVALHAAELELNHRAA